MSSPDRISGLLAAALAALALGGCIRPLYGPTASGARLGDVLASIDVLPVVTAVGQERLGHELRSELIFDLDGSGKTHEKRYRLAIEASEAVQVTTTDTITGRADAAFLNLTARYTLTSIDGARQVTAGTSRAAATYYRDPQRFANVRAAKDAERRAATQVADDIKQRVAAILSTAP